MVARGRRKRRVAAVQRCARAGPTEAAPTAGRPSGGLVPRSAERHCSATAENRPRAHRSATDAMEK